MQPTAARARGTDHKERRKDRSTAFVVNCGSCPKAVHGHSQILSSFRVALRLFYRDLERVAANRCVVGNKGCRITTPSTSGGWVTSVTGAGRARLVARRRFVL